MVTTLKQNAFDPSLFRDVTPEKMAMIFQRLRTPFLPEEHEFKPNDVRDSKATPLVYIDARTVQQRLDTVFGLGGWSTRTNVMLGEETISKKDYKTQAVTSKSGLLTAVSVEISVHCGDVAMIQSNVGEMNPNAASDNKLTTAWSQAFKRAATLLGIGTYLYGLKLPKLAYDKTKRTFKNAPDLFDYDEEVAEAVRAHGFMGLCEETGEPVSWADAAWTVANLGRVLSKESAQKYL